MPRKTEREGGSPPGGPTSEQQRLEDSRQHPKVKLRQELVFLVDTRRCGPREPETESQQGLTLGKTVTSGSIMVVLTMAVGSDDSV